MVLFLSEGLYTSSGLPGTGTATGCWLGVTTGCVEVMDVPRVGWVTGGVVVTTGLGGSGMTEMVGVVVVVGVTPGVAVATAPGCCWPGKPGGWFHWSSGFGVAVVGVGTTGCWYGVRTPCGRSLTRAGIWVQDASIRPQEASAIP